MKDTTVGHVRLLLQDFALGNAVIGLFFSMELSGLMHHGPLAVRIIFTLVMSASLLFTATWLCCAIKSHCKQLFKSAFRQYLFGCFCLAITEFAVIYGLITFAHSLTKS